MDRAVLRWGVPAAGIPGRAPAACGVHAQHACAAFFCTRQSPGRLAALSRPLAQSLLAVVLVGADRAAGIMASEKKRDKKQQMNMNWQAEKAQELREKLQSLRPEVQVRQNEMRKNLMDAVDFLRSERNGEKKEKNKWIPTGKRNTDFLTIAQVKERTHIDIANDTYKGFLGLRGRLEQSPKIEWNGSDRLRYKVRG